MNNKNQNNKILCNYNNHFIVQNDIGDIEVINESGDKFYIRLDDSKTNGNRKTNCHDRKFLVVRLYLLGRAGISRAKKKG